MDCGGVHSACRRLNWFTNYSTSLTCIDGALTDSNTDSDLTRLFSDDRADFARLGKRTIDALSNYLSDLPDEAVERVVPDAQRRFLSTLEMPSRGMSADDIITFMEQQILPWPQATGHQRSFGWVNSPPMPVSVLAESVAQTMNAALDGYDFSGIFLMVSLGRWLRDLAGFPEGDESMALLFSGGSAANLNALTTARHAAAKQDGWNVRGEGLQGKRPAMIAYASDQVHSSVQRCIEQLGLGGDNLRKVPTDASFRMDAAALKQMIAADRTAGLRPFAVIASAGTTNTGAIDPLDAIADVCEDAGAWFHVDGAYGGFGGLDPDYSDSYASIGRADTLTIDPHKWLHVPIDCGALLTRRKSMHREAFSLTPAYLEAGAGDSAPWPYEYMFQLTYANRALKTWAALARMGKSGVRDLIIRCNRLATLLDKYVAEAHDLEILSPTSLSVVNFRYVPEGRDLEHKELDDLNQRISDAVSASGEAHIPTTRVNGQLSLRACILHYENDEADIHHLVELVRRLGAELAPL